MKAVTKTLALNAQLIYMTLKDVKLLALPGGGLAPGPFTSPLQTSPVLFKQHCFFRVPLALPACLPLMSDVKNFMQQADVISACPYM